VLCISLLFFAAEIASLFDSVLIVLLILMVYYSHAVGFKTKSIAVIADAVCPIVLTKMYLMVNL
jgi:hypothetical protein